jgi:hypothetical protein
MTPLQRVWLCEWVSLPLSLFRCAPGQILASGAIPEADRGLHTTHTVTYPVIVNSERCDTMKTVQRFETGIARTH